VTKATTFHNEYGLIETTDESIAAKMDTQRLFLRKGVKSEICCTFVHFKQTK